VAFTEISPHKLSLVFKVVKRVLVIYELRAKYSLVKEFWRAFRANTPPYFSKVREGGVEVREGLRPSQKPLPFPLIKGRGKRVRG